MGENRLFNKKPLETLNSDDELLESARVAGPSLMIALAAMLVMCAVAAYWCIFGTVNHKVTAQGVVIPFHAQEQETEAWSEPQESGQTNHEMLVYVLFDDVFELEAGQQAQVTPANMKREEYGYVYGKITGIGKYPTTCEDVAKELGMNALASYLPSGKAIYEVKVLLDKDSSPSGFRWSRKKSEAIAIPACTFCDVEVITMQKRVYEVLLGGIEDAVNGYKEE